MAHRAVDVPPRDDPYHLAVVGDGETLVAEQTHLARGLADRRRGGDGPHRPPRHDAGHRGSRRCHLAQYGQQPVVDVADVGVADQGRRRPAVAAPAKAPRYLAHIDVVIGAASNEVHPVLDGDDQEDGVGVEQVAQAVGQGRNLVDGGGCGGRGDDDAVRAEGVGLGGASQLIQQILLGVAEGVIQVGARLVQVCAVVEQPGDGAGVAGSRIAVGQGAGVLVQAEQQQRGFNGGDVAARLGHLLDEERRARAGLLAFEGHAGG